MISSKKDTSINHFQSLVYNFVSANVFFMVLSYGFRTGCRIGKGSSPY